MEKKTIALLSNITTGIIANKCARKYDVIEAEGYDAWIPEILNPASNIYNSDIDFYFIILDGTEAIGIDNEIDLTDRLDDWKKTISYFLNLVKDKPVYVSSIIFKKSLVKPVKNNHYISRLEFEWNSYIYDLSLTVSNLRVMDLASLIRQQGEKSFYSSKMWYMGSMPYSNRGIRSICDEIDRLLTVESGQRKKIIVLDLDNTLWGGAIGEEGVSGIELDNHKMGARYHDFQTQLLKMKEQGILLAICSKNNYEDVKPVFTEHPHMVLKEEDFVSIKINWDDKPSNIKAIEKELNLTEGSFLFIDDNPIEREQVKDLCPEVTVPEFPSDTADLYDFAEDIYLTYFQPIHILKEDENKTRMYQQEAKRKVLKSSSINLEDYIKKLEVSVDIHSMTRDEITRVTQLCNKTNQFNLTTIRYSEEEIQKYYADPEVSVLVVSSKDKYGDNGIIGVIILKNQDQNVYIDSFLMSCRVMGRQIEDVIIDQIAGFYKEKAERLIGKYIPTKKNVPVEKLYERLGFDIVEDTEEAKKYVMNLSGYTNKDLKHFSNITVAF